MIKGAMPTREIGAKLFTGSYGMRPAYKVALAACAAITVSIV